MRTDEVTDRQDQSWSGLSDRLHVNHATPSLAGQRIQARPELNLDAVNCGHGNEEDRSLGGGAGIEPGHVGSIGQLSKATLGPNQFML